MPRTGTQKAKESGPYVHLEILNVSKSCPYVTATCHMRKKRNTEQIDAFSRFLMALTPTKEVLDWCLVPKPQTEINNRECVCKLRSVKKKNNQVLSILKFSIRSMLFSYSNALKNRCVSFVTLLYGGL